MLVRVSDTVVFGLEHQSQCRTGYDLQVRTRCDVYSRTDSIERHNVTGRAMKVEGKIDNGLALGICWGPSVSSNDVVPGATFS